MRSPRGDRPNDDRTRLTALYELGRALLAGGSCERVADAALHELRRLVPAHYLSFVLYDEPDGPATVAASFTGADPVMGSRWDREAFGPTDGLAAGDPVVFEDLAVSPTLPPALGAVARAGIRSVVEVPLVSDERLVGLLVAGGPEPGWFQPGDVDALTAAGGLIGPALTRAAEADRAEARAIHAERRVRSLERSLADQRGLLSQVATSQEQERQRLAIDIHDDSVQVMTVAAMKMETLRELVQNDELTARLDDIQETVRLATARLRHLMFELLPPTLDREGLGPALSLYLERVRKDTGIAYVFESRVHGHAPSETRTALYRIAQEAVRNVVEHAKASRIEVLLDRREGGVWIRVGDDGGGFSMVDVETRLPMHLGLTAMRQHAELAGGWCRVRSTPGNGTTVEAWVPGEAATRTPSGLTTSA